MSKWDQSEQRLNKSVMNLYGEDASYQIVTNDIPVGDPLLFKVDLQTEVDVIEGAEITTVDYAISIDPTDLATPKRGDLVTIVATGRIFKLFQLIDKQGGQMRFEASPENG